MTEPVPRKPPLPVALAFITCKDVYRDSRTDSAILVGPTSYFPVSQFPVHVRLSVWAEITGGHGSYQPRLSLLDDADEVVWGWSGNVPFEHNNPLSPHELTIHDLMVAVPHPGRYQLLLLLNNELLAQRGMSFGPNNPRAS